MSRRAVGSGAGFTACGADFSFASSLAASLWIAATTDEHSRTTCGVHTRTSCQPRTQDELDQITDALVEFVTKNPGLRTEQINKQLGTSTKDVALPIRNLLAEGVLKAKGKKRSTAYFPGESKKSRR